MTEGLEHKKIVKYINLTILDNKILYNSLYLDDYNIQIDQNGGMDFLKNFGNTAFDYGRTAVKHGLRAVNYGRTAVKTAYNYIGDTIGDNIQQFITNKYVSASIRTLDGIAFKIYLKNMLTPAGNSIFDKLCLISVNSIFDKNGTMNTSNFFTILSILTQVSFNNSPTITDMFIILLHEIWIMFLLQKFFKGQAKSVFVSSSNTNPDSTKANNAPASAKNSKAKVDSTKTDSTKADNAKNRKAKLDSIKPNSTKADNAPGSAPDNAPASALASASGSAPDNAPDNAPASASGSASGIQDGGSGSISDLASNFYKGMSDYLFAIPSMTKDAVNTAAFETGFVSKIATDTANNAVNSVINNYKDGVAAASPKPIAIPSMTKDAVNTAAFETGFVSKIATDTANNAVNSVINNYKDGVAAASPKPNLSIFERIKGNCMFILTFLTKLPGLVMDYVSNMSIYDKLISAVGLMLILMGCALYNTYQPGLIVSGIIFFAIGVYGIKNCMNVDIWMVLYPIIDSIKNSLGTIALTMMNNPILTGIVIVSSIGVFGYGALQMKNFYKALRDDGTLQNLSLIHISEPTRQP
jgi:hypothetical protein